MTLIEQTDEGAMHVQMLTCARPEELLTLYRR